MKKLCLMAITMLMVSFASCSGEKKGSDSAAADTAAAPATEQAAAQDEAAPAADLMASADAVAKKIDANEPLNEADFIVVCDYMAAMYDDMDKNPTDIEGLMAKFNLVDKFSKAFESYDMESLSPEAQAKLENMQSKKP